MKSTATRADGAPNLRSLKRLELDRAATDVVAKYGTLMMNDAVKYSATLEDAEDAYQRALVILLAKAPSTNEKQLVPWLRVVVKNEALDIARGSSKRELNLSPEVLDGIESPEATPEEEAEAGNEIEIGFEALGRLSEDQTRCLLAQAAGLEYEEIAARTGFSRRKVSRCLQRGRIAFSQQVSAIAAGSECERMQPLIHRVLAADAEAAIELRPHLRHCLACRTRLREYQEAPRKVAALLPPAIALTDSEPEGFFAGLFAQWQSAIDALSVRALGAERWVDLVTAKKAVAIVAVASATATSGVAIKKVTEKLPDHTRAQAQRQSNAAPATPRPLLDEVHVPARVARTPKRRRHPKTDEPPIPTTNQSQPDADRSTSSGGELDDGSLEFAPETRSAQ